MKISIVIPTINRGEDLHKLLLSLKRQNCEIFEIIIVDQGDIKKTRELINSVFGKKSKNVELLQQKEASLTKARNKGVSKASGDIILFLDDDTEISKNYICNLIRLQEKYKDTMAFAGVFKAGKENSLLKRLVGSLFCVSKIREARNVFLRSGHNLMRANESKEPIFVEWVSGLNMAYRKEIFDDGLTFFEGFTKYSLGEDAMFSYSVFKRYGKHAVLVHPDLKVKHNESNVGRLKNLQLLKMRIIYKYITWNKLINKEKGFDFICYLISEIFMGLYYIFKSENKIAAVTVSAKSYIYLIKNHKKIVHELIDYNDFIFS